MQADEEDLTEALESDYVSIPELDRYDALQLDDREFPKISHSARLRAESDIRFRQSKREESNRLYGAPTRSTGNLLLDCSRQQSFHERSVASGLTTDQNHEVNLEAVPCPLREWLALETTRREVKRRFLEFLEVKKPDLHLLNESMTDVSSIAAMCAANLASLEISFRKLSATAPILAVWLVDAPRELLEIFDEVASTLVLSEGLFPAYLNIQENIHVRIVDLPIVDNLRNLRHKQLNRLVCVRGVVTKRTGVLPQLNLVQFSCTHCQSAIGPFKQHGKTLSEPGACPRCQGTGPFRLDFDKSIFQNYQRLTIQEATRATPPGRIPRHKDVVVQSDLIDKARPGEEIEIVGILTYALETPLAGHGIPTLPTVIEANNLHELESARWISTSISEIEKMDFLTLARDPNVAKRVAFSLAPSIYGHHHAKRSLAMALFGGCSKDVEGKHRIRGDVNVLLLGDPGCAKSQLLKYCCSLLLRAVYTTGKGASAVGLTAAVHKDVESKDWTLEGGALVLADSGLCCIDEFDKMNEQDRTSIHEAMEQQSISVSKAGIVTTLRARCSIVAAANPVGGLYNCSLSLPENVELTEPILQRFDLLCILQDVVDPVNDEQLASVVINSHRNSATGWHRSLHMIPQTVTTPDLATSGQCDIKQISQITLRKYISYARNFCRPYLHSIDQNRIACLYADLRRTSLASGGVPIAVRHVESLVRMAEAHAKMSLQSFVRDEDVEAAISLLVSAFLAAQKVSVRGCLERAFRQYLTSSEDVFILLLHVLRSLVREVMTFGTVEVSASILAPPERNQVKVRMDDFEHQASRLAISHIDIEKFYASPSFVQSFMLLRSSRAILWYSTRSA